MVIPERDVPSVQNDQQVRVAQLVRLSWRMERITEQHEAFDGKFTRHEQ